LLQDLGTGDIVPSIELGNVSMISMITDPATGVRTKYRANHVDQTITTINLPMGRDLLTALQEINAVWAAESDAPPAWVSCSDDPDLEALLKRHFSCGDRPDDYEIVITGPSLLVPMEEGVPNVQVSTEGSEE
jgi:hypothetical protein